MPDLIRSYDNRNEAIVDAGSEVLSLTYFNILHLEKDQAYRQPKMHLPHTRTKRRR